MPHNPKVRTAATARITPALPRRVSSCVDLPALFFAVRFHFAASLRQAHGASPPRRKRSRRPSCLRSQPRGYHHRHRINDQQCGWGGSARLIWPCCSVCVSHQRDVPKGTVVLRSVRDETDIDVTADPRSSALKSAALRPKRAHGATPGTCVSPLVYSEPRWPRKPTESSSELDDRPFVSHRFHYVHSTFIRHDVFRDLHISSP